MLKAQETCRAFKRMLKTEENAQGSRWLNAQDCWTLQIQPGCSLRALYAMVLHSVFECPVARFAFDSPE